MNAFAAAVVEDLRGFCSDLLEPGLAPAMASSARAAGRVPATFTFVLGLVDAFAAIVPRLVESLDAGESMQRVEVAWRRTPAQAAMPRSPLGYELAGSRLLPRHWERVTPLLEPDVAPLGFVHFVLLRLGEDFEAVRGRLRRHVDEARAARTGTSSFARQDLDELAALDARLERAATLLVRCVQTLQLVTAGRVAPTDRLPHPFPRSPVWRTFRRLADAVLRPSQHLAATIAELLRDAPAIADLPFLYQRWVGTRIVLELTRSFGCRVSGDVIGPLFLGGMIPLHRGSTRIQLWSEPRLGRANHPSGLFAAGAEATPDFVFVTPGHGGDDAFVLDATLSQDPTLVERKTRYRERIAFHRFRPQAGVPGRHRPLRAWAAAPLLGTALNRLTRPDGSAGVVPMHPEAYEPEPLRAWLGDLVEHADAWQLFAAAHAGPAAAHAGEA